MRNLRGSRRRVRPALFVLPVLVLATGLLLSGCVRVKAAMAISEDDRVSGQIVAGSITSGTAATLNVPSRLTDRVQVKPYSADGYTGSELDFTGLTFDELRMLTTQSNPSAPRYQFTLHRSGDVVTLAGAIDLTQLPPSRADIGLKINFPGKITSTNGKEDDDTITWEPKPGKVNELTATVQSNSAGASPLMRWSVLVAVAAGAVALLVLVLALVARHRTLRAGAA